MHSHNSLDFYIVYYSNVSYIFSKIPWQKRRYNKIPHHVNKHNIKKKKKKHSNYSNRWNILTYSKRNMITSNNHRNIALFIVFIHYNSNRSKKSQHKIKKKIEHYIAILRKIDYNTHYILLVLS